MTFIADCPLPAALTPISAQDCSNIWGQIAGFAVQRIDDSNNNFTAPGNAITAEVSWDTFAAASDNTKIIYTPFLGAGLTIPESTANETGGNDNTTIEGIPIYNGEDVVQVTGMFRNLNKTVVNELRMLTDESLSAIGRTNVGAYLFPEQTASDNRVIAREITTDSYAPIRIYNFRLSSVGTEGFNAQNTYTVSFYLTGRWDDDVDTISGLDFNPLDKLANA